MKQECNSQHVVYGSAQSSYFVQPVSVIIDRRCERNSALLVTGAPVAHLSPGFDSRWERISQDITAFVLSVVGVVPVDSEMPVVTSSILSICRHSLRRCS
jgi:hypothetical protein